GRCFRLARCAWVTVQEKPVGDVALVEPVCNHTVGHIVRYEVSGIDVGLSFFAELSELFDVITENVSGGDSRDGHLVGNTHCLGALSRPRMAHDEHTSHILSCPC